MNRHTLKLVSTMVLVVMLLGLSSISALAQTLPPAKTVPWVVSVTYQNVGTGAATVMVDFYAEGGAVPVTFNPLLGIGDGTLAAGAGASFYIGSVTGIADGFRGNAIMSSDQPLVATVVQFSQTTGYKMRLLSNGFQTADASDQYLVATTLLNKFSRTTVFSIQNTENATINATVRFYDADNNGALAATKVHEDSCKLIEVHRPDVDHNGYGATGIDNLFQWFRHRDRGTQGLADDAC